MNGNYTPTDSLLSHTRRLLRRHNLHTRKRLGQHFLICADVLETILKAAEISGEDIVLEVGPGLGVLTAELVKSAGYVIAIELDDALAAVLKNTFSEHKNISLVNRDVLQVEPSLLLEEHRAAIPAGVNNRRYKLVANLPYYITAPLLRHFLESGVKPETMVLTIQKEVAQTLVAAPGDMRLLSVSVQFYARPEIITIVPSSCFYPEPEVDSAVVRITPFKDPPPVKDVEGFFRLVRAGFSTPRKRLSNSLAQGLQEPKTAVEGLLQAAGIESLRRAETLGLAEWIKLWDVYRVTGHAHD